MINLRYFSLSTFILVISVVSTFAQEQPKQNTTNTDDIVAVPDEQPTYPGGTQAMADFIEINLHYPEEARKKKLEGNVFVQFTVNQDGTLSDVKTLRGLPDFSEEAERIFKSMEPWVPGKVAGKPVRVRCTGLVRFNLASYIIEKPKEPAKFVGKQVQQLQQTWVIDYPDKPHSLSDFVAENVKYPESVTNGYPDININVRFIINQDGSVTNVHAITSGHKDFDHEAENVIRSMPKWIPAKSNDSVFRSINNVNIAFSKKIPERDSLKKLNEKLDPDPSHANTEGPPEFPGGISEMIKFLAHNIRYPNAAKRNGDEGKVFVKFIVNKNGVLSDVHAVKGFQRDCDAEAVRVIESMPQWKPGYQNGKFVRVEIIVPIVFRLGR